MGKGARGLPLGMPEPLQEQDPVKAVPTQVLVLKWSLEEAGGLGKNDLQGLYLESRYLFFFFFCIFLSGISLCNSSRKSNTNNIFKWKPSLTMS